MTLPNRDAAKVRVPPPLPFIVGIVLGVIVQRKVAPLSLALAPMPRIAAGVFIAACGIGLFISALILFIRTGQHPRPWTPTPELIFNGPYRFTRNPIYVAFVLVETGLGLAVNNLWISLFAAPALLVVHFTAVLPEERYLAGKFGESYRSFLARVRRYF